MAYTGPTTVASSSSTSGPQLGCTDPTATNYNPAATVDDGSCVYAAEPVVPIYNEGITVSFSEVAKGWTSFKSFVQDSGLSLNNDYYTFKNTNVLDVSGTLNSTDFLIWKHHTSQKRNNFYRQQYDSHVDVLFNEESATVKSFASMKYEGSQAKITENLTDPAYFNNQAEKGWYVESGVTDLQLAGEMEFKDKEGKWFSYMRGTAVKITEDLNSKEFSFQGIGVLEDYWTTGNVFGCTDPTATNYDASATDDDGSCTYPPYSCWECVETDTQGVFECQEDTDPLNGPCTGSGKYTGLPECETLTNYCTGPPPSLYTLTISDVTPSVQQINYSVSTFTQTGIPGDSILPLINSLNGMYKLEISAEAGYTVQATDFGIEFPTGVAALPSAPYGTGGFGKVIYGDIGFWVPPNVGQGNDLGTGPLVSSVTFWDSENPSLDPNWVGPSGSNKVIVECTLRTDMQDNVPGLNPGYTQSDVDVYMTHNGMQSTNSINAGIPGDLHIDINIIGSAQQYLPGCTDPLAVNYNASATIDDGSCSYAGCTDPTATNYNALALTDDGSCTYPPICGCTDNTPDIDNSTQFGSRPTNYYGPATNYNINATVLCEDGCLDTGCFQGQVGQGCCCEYDPCNVAVQSLDGTLAVTNSNNAAQNTGSCVINGITSWVPAIADISINVYTGTTNDEVTGLKSIFWNPGSLAAGWGNASTTSIGTVVHQNDSGIDPGGWHTINDLPPGDYHVRIDTGDDCHVWYDFTIGDDFSSPTDIYGCTDACACNYNSAANIDDGSCESRACTDSTALNYDSTAFCDDGSCCYDLTPTFTIVGDTSYTGPTTNGYCTSCPSPRDANGSIKIEIPNSYAAGGIPQFDVNGNPMQVRVSARYYAGQIWFDTSNFILGGTSPYTGNTLPGIASWFGPGQNYDYVCEGHFCYGGPRLGYGWMSYNTTLDTWTIGNDSTITNISTNQTSTNQYVAIQQPASNHGPEFGAIGGYHYGDSTGSGCPTTPDPTQGYGSTLPTSNYHPDNITNADWIAGANYVVTVMYRTSGGVSCGTGPWCKKRFYLYVPCS